ncbi:hypothetical protein OIU34_19640 [Pararhizobium sp. BT-229]|uniref:hypothetical protein n=1 Tax=Pararhizobium sp. BT-229 TaxID=2986923 RepID=UPI0021F72267|nr:hypothetical protein [Pararhizobium sp. BT-229]MCV9964098.1 hypothetical protein [Pararhizobium sp. BT-229]
MSRTYRAKTGDRWWRENGRPIWPGDRFSDRPDTYAKYWESDNPNRWAIVKVATKQQHREVGRADTRAELGRIMKDVEHDFYNRENLYKGFSWNHD